MEIVLHNNATALQEHITAQKIAPTMGEQLVATYTPFFNAAAALIEQAMKIQVTDPTQVTEMKQARAVRLSLAKVRCEAEKKRAEMKEGFTRAGNAIQFGYNLLRDQVHPVEKVLYEFETLPERLEAERQKKLGAERGVIARRLGINQSEADLGKMPAEHWCMMVAGAKQAEAERHAKAMQEAEEAAEREEAALQARIAEQKRLAEERKRLMEQKRLADEALYEAEKRRQAELAEEKKKADAALSEERKKREAAEKLAAEALRQQEQAEAARRETEKAAALKAEAERQAAAQLAAAPDKEKLLAFCKNIESLRWPQPETVPAASAIEQFRLAYRTLLEKAEQL